MKNLCKLALALCAAGCGVQPDTYDAHGIILVDITDSLTVVPEASSILDVTGLTADPWKGVSLEVTTISDNDHGAVTEFTLPARQRASGNRKVRNAQVARYERALADHLEGLLSGSTGTLDHSVVIRSLCHALVRLAASPIPDKYLFVYSDLREYGDADFYSNKVLRRLETEPEAMRQELFGDTPLPDLSGITVWLLYDPKEYRDNTEYRIIAQFFATVLESYGAEVHIGQQPVPLHSYLKCQTLKTLCL